jgi:hypothetical protein
MGLPGHLLPALLKYKARLHIDVPKAISFLPGLSQGHTRPTDRSAICRHPRIPPGPKHAFHSQFRCIPHGERPRGGTTSAAARDRPWPRSDAFARRSRGPKRSARGHLPDPCRCSRHGYKSLPFPIRFAIGTQAPGGVRGSRLYVGTPSKKEEPQDLRLTSMLKGPRPPTARLYQGRDG